MTFVFDMDGTLTESSCKIDVGFKKFLMQFFENNSCAIITGAEMQSIIFQLSADLVSKAEWLFACNGEHIVHKGKTIFKGRWILKPSAKRYLENFVRDSSFPYRTGYHFDDRIGMCNFSVLGRNATPEQRRHYIAWDIATNERQNIAKKFNNRFNNIKARVAGETGIDITHSHAGKASLLKYINKEEVKFFGDKMDRRGNDFPLANRLQKSQRFPVTNWKDTYSLLHQYTDNHIHT
tara:strand:- start:767 stop:1474 length:708 start_codon:yes stop_codon:yes gene_type:complete